MINFYKNPSIEKLDIDPNYYYDIAFEVDTTKLADIEGNIWIVNTVIATKEEVGSNIAILLNVTQDEYIYYQMDIEQFVDSETLTKEIEHYIEIELSYV